MTGVRRFPERTWAHLSDGDEIVGCVLLTFRVWFSEGCWQAKCSELEVPSFGEDAGDALNAAIDATIGYLNEIEGNEEREHIFAKRGLVFRTGPPQGGPHDNDQREETVKRRDEGALLMGLSLAARG